MGVFLLAGVVPVAVAEFEVGFARQGEEGDFVEDGVNPQAFYRYVDVADFFVASGVGDGLEGEFYLV